MTSPSIYEDLNDISIGDKLINAREENKKLLQHIENLQGDISKLCNELTQMKTRESNLKRNISELFNTAMMETNRKQRMISELQSKLESFRYRSRSMSYKRSREDDEDLKEPKVAKIDLTILDKHDKKSSNSSRERSKSTNRHAFSDKQAGDSSRREKSRDSKETRHRSKSTHRPKSSTSTREHSVKDSHKHKSNIRYYDTSLTIEVKNNERVVNKSDSTLKNESNIHINSKTEPVKSSNSHRSKTKKDSVKVKDGKDVKPTTSTPNTEPKPSSNKKKEKTKSTGLEANASSSKNSSTEKTAVEKSKIDSTSINHQKPENDKTTDSNDDSEKKHGETNDVLPKTTIIEKEEYSDNDSKKENHCQEDTKTIEPNKEHSQISEHQNILKDTHNYVETTPAPMDLIKSSTSEVSSQSISSVEIKADTENRSNVVRRRRRCIIKVVN